MPLAAFPKCFLETICVEHAMTPEQWIDLAATQLDIDGLEFFINFTPVDDPAHMLALRKQTEAHGLTIPMMCCSPDFTKPDPEGRKEEVERQKRSIEATAFMGGKYCRVLSGQRRPDVPLETGIRYAAECIRECIPHAEKHGIVLNLENHYKDSFWSYPEMAQKMEAFLALLDAVGESPNFGVNYDPSNAVVAGDDPIALLEAVKHRVVSMHASDRYFDGGTFEDLKKLDAHPMQGYAGILKHGIIGQGMNDYDRIFSILASVGFTGWISIEDGQDPTVGMEHLKLSADFLRAKMKQHGLK
ncbi:MAG: sugar phosphate isomerase/epimerase [Fimbriimonas sp.]|nr:sugar phosphate isomerase/epimerase [Fimbriimonas sp.]